MRRVGAKKTEELGENYAPNEHSNKNAAEGECMNSCESRRSVLGEREGEGHELEGAQERARGRTRVDVTGNRQQKKRAKS